MTRYLKHRLLNQSLGPWKNLQRRPRSQKRQLCPHTFPSRVIRLALESRRTGLAGRPVAQLQQRRLRNLRSPGIPLLSQPTTLVSVNHPDGLAGRLRLLGQLASLRSLNTLLASQRTRSALGNHLDGLAGKPQPLDQQANLRSPSILL